MLVDNGSKRPAATLGLRALAARLAEASGRPVQAVSLQHADKIPAAELDGEAAKVFPSFVRQQLEIGVRDFVVVPLFFGESRALTSFIPEQIDQLRGQYGQITVRLAEPLVPLSVGEPRLVQILADNIAKTHTALDGRPSHVLLVDHGSPKPAVTAVRQRLAGQLAELMPVAATLGEAVMERRPGPEYDFNGPLLAQALDDCAAQNPQAHVAVAMLFLLPGRHAGPGGDVTEICADAIARNPGLRVAVSPLVGEHPRVTEILYDRLTAVL